MVQEPVVSVNNNEGIADWNFEDPTGYTYDPAIVDLSAGELKLQKLPHYATVDVQLYNGWTPDVVLPTGTLFTTDPLSPPVVSFVVPNDTPVPVVGGGSSTLVNCICTTPGTIGNIAINTLTVMTPVIVGIDSFHNAVGSGGADPSGYTSGTFYVISPPLKPKRVKKWIRLTTIPSVPVGCGIQVEVQFSSDSGIRWGSNPPFTDGEWIAYSKPVFDWLEPMESGTEAIRFRIALISDGSDTPVIDPLEITWDIYSYVPIPNCYSAQITSKQIVSDLSLGTVLPNQISDTALKYAEYWAITSLRNEGIDWQDTVVQDDEVVKMQLEIAASSRCLCLTARFGLGTVVSGALQSISAEGISKAYAGKAGGKNISNSAEDFCEQSRESINNVIQMFRAGLKTAQQIMPGWSRDNEMLDQSMHETGFDVRRRYYPNNPPANLNPNTNSGEG